VQFWGEELFVTVCLRDDMNSSEGFPSTTHSVAESIPHIIWAAAADGSVEYFNSHGLDYTGLAPEDLYGWGWLNLIDPADLPRVAEAWKQAIEDGQSLVAECRLRRNDGTYHWHEATAVPVRDSNRRIQMWVAIWINVDDRKNADKKLRESRARFEGVIESAMDAIITIDEMQRVVLFNGAAERMFGCSAAGALGQSLDRFIPSRLRAAHRAHVRGFEATGVTSRAMGKLGDLLGLRADGSEFPIEASISQTGAGGAKLFTVILRDITVRKETEENLSRSQKQLRALAARLQRAREEEGMRIARELHDQLGRCLTSIKMDLLWIEKTVSRHPADEEIHSISEKTQMMLEAIDETVTVVRRISTELRPGILDDLGLAAAVEWQAMDFQRRSGVSCILNIPEEDLELSRDQATAFFRIFQEILTNVARHSQAGKIWVSLEARDGIVALEVEDDGVGISPDAASQPHALGLAGMRERAATFGGHVEFSGIHGKGTTVIVRMPIDENPGR
jgi:PAS domain S-box-containing protein